VDIIASLGVLMKRRISFSCWEWYYDSSLAHPVV